MNRNRQVAATMAIVFPELAGVGMAPQKRASARNRIF
jgi:hypothetical protein